MSKEDNPQVTISLLTLMALVTICIIFVGIAVNQKITTNKDIRTINNYIMEIKKLESENKRISEINKLQKQIIKELEKVDRSSIKVAI